MCYSGWIVCRDATQRCAWCDIALQNWIQEKCTLNPQLTWEEEDYNINLASMTISSHFVWAVKREWRCRVFVTLFWTTIIKWTQVWFNAWQEHFAGAPNKPCKSWKVFVFLSVNVKRKKGRPCFLFDYCVHNN